MKVSLGVNIFMRWVFNFCLFGIFPLMVLAYEMSNPGGGVEYDMIFIARTVCDGYLLILVFVPQFFPRFLLFLLFGVA